MRGIGGKTTFLFDGVGYTAQEAIRLFDNRLNFIGYTREGDRIQAVRRALANGGSQPLQRLETLPHQEHEPQGEHR